MKHPAKFTCLKCGKPKPVTEFARDKHSKRGHTPYCKTCRSKWAREFRKTNQPERKRSLAKYGLTHDDYERMHAAQGGRCAICGTTESKGHGGKHLAVDHDHETGEVRGLLCGNCNRGIGWLNDDPDVVQRAADYLRKPTERRVP